MIKNILQDILGGCKNLIDKVPKKKQKLVIYDISKIIGMTKTRNQSATKIKDYFLL